MRGYSHLGSGTNLANFARTVTNAMAKQKASERMNELIHSLQQAIGRLEEGKLGLNELEQCTEDARAIFERFVVLRHKAREAAVGAGKKAVAPEAPLRPNRTKEPAATEEEAQPPMRLDTRPAEITPLQTSLIDAIAETENGGEEEPATPAPKAEKPTKSKAEEPTKPKAEEPAKPKAAAAHAEAPKPEEPAKPKAEEPTRPKAEEPKPEEPAKPTAEEPKQPKPEEPTASQPLKAKPATVNAPVEQPLTVAGKMEQAPVADLRKAIALSQKFWFVAELFAGDRNRYENAIDSINAMGGLDEAQAYMNTEITAKLPKPPGEEVAATFTDLLQRRFS